MITKTQAKPFLKWAGGKQSLLPQILPHIPSEIKGTYYEPFLGGGALFFHLQPKQAILSDINPELVNTYVQVRDNLEDLIRCLELHQLVHNREHYYEVRDYEIGSEIDRAARFIYLNKTCFNGLHRVNKAGKFNVPIGDYNNPRICDKESLMAASKALQGIDIYCRSFTDLDSKNISIGDFIYFDPPYAPVSKSSNFTGYAKAGFPDRTQLALADVFGMFAEWGLSVALSNSDCDFVREMYSDYDIHSISARRSINSKGGDRGAVGEVLVTANCGEK